MCERFWTLPANKFLAQRNIGDQNSLEKEQFIERMRKSVAKINTYEVTIREKLESLRNFRNNNIAHKLESKSDSVKRSAKYGDEDEVFHITKAAVVDLYWAIDGAACSFESTEILVDQCTRELWSNCYFNLQSKKL